LEGFRRLNTIKAHSDNSSQNPLLNANGFFPLSERVTPRRCGEILIAGFPVQLVRKYHGDM